MGQGLFDEVGEFASAEREIDSLLGYSIRRLCLEDPQRRLDRTEYTQPGVYVVNALHYLKALAGGARPDYLAGHSLGEYNALHAAGVFDFLTGLRLVKKRGELMAQARDGGMAAVIGLHALRVVQLLQDNGFERLDIANYNSPVQIVIAGPTGDIERVRPIFERAGAQLFVSLPVSGAFHSRYMAPAAEVFAEFLRPVAFTAPRIPVIANVTGRPYPADAPTTGIRFLLIRQLTEAVQWTSSIRYLIAQGARSFEEIGPGGTVTRLIQQIQQERES